MIMITSSSVLGGAAFSSAIEAVTLNAKVAMIERGTVGGTCVNVGCVPSKTLLRAGEINHLAKIIHLWDYTLRLQMLI